MPLPPFFKEICDDDASKVKEMLASGHSVNDKYAEHYTPLEMAIDDNAVKVIDILLAHGADHNELSGNPKGEPVTPLMSAVKKANLKIVKLLLARGVDIHVMTRRDHTALHLAVEDKTKKHAAIMEELIKAGADVNAKGMTTVLMDACRSASADMVASLIRHGADVNAKTSSGNALRRAIEEERLENVQVLLDHGADVKSVCYDDKTPLEIAKKVGNKKIIKLLEAALAGGKVEAKADTRTFAEIVGELERAVAEKAPALKASFHVGASISALGELERVLPVSVPVELRTYLLQHDGQESSGDPLFAKANSGEDFWLMPVKQIAFSWKSLKECLTAGDFEDEGGPDRGIQANWWRPEWVPFATNGGGDYLCVDLAPAEGGTVGQIISWYHEESKRELVALSFATLLAEVAGTIGEA